MDIFLTKIYLMGIVIIGQNIETNIRNITDMEIEK